MTDIPKGTTDSPSMLESSRSDGLSPTAVRSIQGSPEKPIDWTDHGVIDVPVDKLPDPEYVSSPSDFDHHITWDNAVSATKQLPDIQREVNAGKTGDDFSASDDANNLDYQNGQRRIYDLYYGNDPITLDKVGENYTIVSGRHRIFAAKSVGLETVPAWVREKKT